MSVIIPVRNEAANILNILQDLENQSFDRKQFEVIIADDGSEDGTPDLVRSFKASYSLRLINIKHKPGTIAFKKSSVSQAVAEAEHNYIFCTDGDCRLPVHLLRVHARALQAGAPFVSGPVALYPARNTFALLQQMEFATLVGSGGALLSAGIPAMCNGANISYSRDAFNKAGGYTGNMDIPSGDDEFLMHKIAAANPGKIKFLRESGATVRTLPAPDAASFNAQRKRWAGKWTRYQSQKLKKIAISVFLFNLNFLLLPLFAFSNRYTAIALLVVLLIKITVEGGFIRQVYYDTGIEKWQARNHIALLMLQAIYPAYVVFFGIFGGLKKGYNWKGREVA